MVSIWWTTIYSLLTFIFNKILPVDPYHLLITSSSSSLISLVYLPLIYLFITGSSSSSFLVNIYYCLPISDSSPSPVNTHYCLFIAVSFSSSIHLWSIYTTASLFLVHLHLFLWSIHTTVCLSMISLHHIWSIHTTACL